MGRLHGLLVVSPEPLSLDELCRESGAAKSTVSVAVRRLQAAGLVERVMSNGDRRDYWTACSSVADAMSMWFDQHISGPLAELRLLEQLSSGEAAERISETVGVLSALEEVLAERSRAE